MIVRHNASRLAALGTLSGAGSRALFDKYENVEMHGFGSAFGADPGNNSLLVVAKLRLAYAAGGAVQKIFPLDWEDVIGKALSYNWANPMMGSVVGTYLADAIKSPGKAALAKEYKNLGAMIDDLSDRKRRWAAAGKRDDGSAFSWQQWGELAQVYLNSIVYYSKMPVTDGFIVNAGLSIKDFFGDLAKVVQPTEWPLWVKVSVGLVGLAAVSYIVRTPAAIK